MQHIDLQHGDFPELQLRVVESCGLTLCPRCAVNFASKGDYCAPCEEIVTVTAKRINMGIDASWKQRTRHLHAQMILQTAFWVTVIGGLIYAASTGR